MHKQAIKHKQAIIGGGYLFTENACCNCVKWVQCIIMTDKVLMDMQTPYT